MVFSSKPPRALRSANPTVHEVAERAGVSPMTVSRVLSGGKNVSAELRERVEAVVAEIGYHRNEIARSLRPGHRSGLIGVLITNISNPYYAEMLLGIEEVASANARRTLLGNTNEDEDLERQLVSDFVGRQVEGLVIVPAGQGTQHLTPGRLGGVPLVLASRPIPALGVDTVLIDDVTGAQRATETLIAEGHRRIAFLGNRVSVSTGQRRFDGFSTALAAAGIAPDAALVRLGQQDASSAELAMTQLLNLPEPPTAVFAANNRNTVGAIRAIRTHRAVSARPDVRVFGFDSFEFADMSPVPLSVVDHDPRALGRVAASMLFERMDDGFDDAPRTVELPVELRDLRP